MRAAIAVLAMVAATACSRGGDAGAQPPTVEEEQALAEARAMIPASELPPASNSETMPSTGPAETETAQP